MSRVEHWRKDWRIRLPLMLVCVALQGVAQAGLFDDEEARTRVEALRKQMIEVNINLETLNRNQLDFANQTESLRAELAKIRGQLEVKTFAVFRWSVPGRIFRDWFLLSKLAN